MVAGPLHRRDIASCLTRLCRHIIVRDMPRGWVVAEVTGRSTPVQTFDELISAAAAHARARTWPDLEQLLLELAAPPRSNTPVNGQLLLPEPSAGSMPVLAAVTHLPAHMKLAAFALGVHSIPSPEPVVTDLGGSQLSARGGRLATTRPTGLSSRPPSRRR
ncbi:hypothetical protein [Corynebacterium hylobatis]|uniref:hypothetical protein n=1 Tax=Corynebacterium hylobatis TaxID=1859290 RepID=UPI001F499EEE|nr:hypothetical protein [Corynebacterium hylobatis]